MIKATSQSGRLLTRVSNGRHEAYADPAVEKGGSGGGFRPHELLEAALAACVNMAVRLRAQRLAIPLEDVEVTVDLDRSDPRRAAFAVSVEISGSVAKEHHQLLMDAARSCPVRETLSREIVFRDRE